MANIQNLPDLRPSLLLDFANSAGVDPRISCSRPFAATRWNAACVLESVPAGVPRIDYDPVTGKCLGLLVEEARTNMVASNATTGAIVGVLGSGGALPAGWSAPTANGLNAEVMAIGVESGIPYVDVKFSGTATTNYQGFVFGNVSGYLTSTTYTASVYTKLLDGSLPSGGSVQFKIRYNHSTGSTDINGSPAYSSFVTERLSSNRLSVSGATSSTSTGAGQLLMVFNYSSGTAINFTMRFGLPQLEAGSGATSPIFTTGTASTRAADAISISISQPDQNYSAAVTYRTGKKLAGMRSLSLRNSIDGKSTEFFAAGSTGTNRNGIVISGSGGNPALVVAPVADTIYKSAVSIYGLRYSFASEKSLLASNQAHTVTPPNSLWFGATGQGSGLHLCGHVMQVAIYIAALSDSQLQRLTA